MQAAARESYLLTEVTTAAPQKLQLLLIEGAIRFARTAQQQWQAGQDEAAADSLTRSQQIVSEIVSGLNPEHDPELVRRVAGIYLFVFRALLAAQLERNEARLAEALSVLEIERETWREMCQRLGATRAAAPVDELPAAMGGFSLTV